MDQLFEVLGRQDIQAAIMLGFILGVAVQFFLGFLTLPFGPDKARIKNQASLLNRLQENGYTVYTPLSTDVDDLALNEPLADDEAFELRMGRYFIVDPQGNALTKMLNHSTTVDQIAEYRRAKFQVIKGGKDESPN